MLLNDDGEAGESPEVIYSNLSHILAAIIYLKETKKVFLVYLQSALSVSRSVSSLNLACLFAQFAVLLKSLTVPLASWNFQKQLNSNYIYSRQIGPVIQIFKLNLASLHGKVRGVRSLIITVGYQTVR